MVRRLPSLAAAALIGFGLLSPAAASAATAEQPVPERKPSRAATITPASRAEVPECTFIGKRIVSLLSRDDIVAATEFREFYEAFDCPTLHLSAAFGCAVDVPEATEEPAADRVERCWQSPSSRPLLPPSVPAAAAAPAAGTDAAAPATPAEPPAQDAPAAAPAAPAAQ